MLDTLLSGPMVPFTLSLALLFALLAVEIVFLLLGTSLVGDGVDMDGPSLGDGPEVDFDLDLESFDLDPGDLDLEFDTDAAVPAAPASSPLSWLGLGRMPTLIWLASLFMSFGVSGLAIQSLAASVVGNPMPALIAVIPSAVIAFWFTGRFGALFARFLPRTETQSVSQNNLGRRIGTVTQGTARRGNPAEVRVTDRYGNTHYLRAEPFRDGEDIPQGTEVLVVRHRQSGGFRLIPL